MSTANRRADSRGDGQRRFVSPVALRVAAKCGVDLSVVVGTGPGGRVLKDDVLAALNGRQMQAGNSTIAADGQPAISETRHVALSPQHRAVAAPLLASRATTPHALTAVEVDMGHVLALCERLQPAFARGGLEPSPLAYVALAIAESLLRHPLLTGFWREEFIVVRRRIHLGVLVAASAGPVSGVIADAQDLNLRGMARAITELNAPVDAPAQRGRPPTDTCFTIASLGETSWYGTATVDQPQSAVLSIGATRTQPLVVSTGGLDRIVSRPVALFALSYDARVFAQPYADAFLHDVKHRLEHISA